MNWKRLGKMMLVLALVVATFSSTLVVARAADTIVSESEEIISDGGGRRSYYRPSAAASCKQKDQDLRFVRFEWELEETDEPGLYGNKNILRAYAIFRCKDEDESKYPTTNHFHCEVQATVKKVTTVYNNPQYGGDYTGQKIIAVLSANQSPDGKAYSAEWTNGTNWIFDRFELDQKESEGYFTVWAVYHNKWDRNERKTVAAHYTATHASENGFYGFLNYIFYINSYEAPDRTYRSSPTRSAEYLKIAHQWVYDRMEWDFDNYNSHTGQGAQAVAKYHDAYNINKTETVPANVSTPNKKAIDEYRYEASFTASLCNVGDTRTKDRWDHYADRTETFYYHTWTFDKIKWGKTDGVVWAKALYDCKADGTHAEIDLTPTKVSSSGKSKYDVHTMFQTYEVSITAEQSLDGKPQHDTYTDYPHAEPVDPGDRVIGPIVRHDINPNLDEIIKDLPIYTPILNPIKP